MAGGICVVYIVHKQSHLCYVYRVDWWYLWPCSKYKWEYSRTQDFDGKLEHECICKDSVLSKVLRYTEQGWPKTVDDSSNIVNMNSLLKQSTVENPSIVIPT